jgi:hypothetical protein
MWPCMYKLLHACDMRIPPTKPIEGQEHPGRRGAPLRSGPDKIHVVDGLCVWISLNQLAVMRHKEHHCERPHYGL